MTHRLLGAPVREPWAALVLALAGCGGDAEAGPVEVPARTLLSWAWFRPWGQAWDTGNRRSICWARTDA